MSPRPRTLLEKIWDAHVVFREPGFPAVLYVDLHLAHEATSRLAFLALEHRGLRVRRPDSTVAAVDHVITTGDRSRGLGDRAAQKLISALGPTPSMSRSPPPESAPGAP